MANKYIRHGETYCGDGTSSAAATSNGGVGAWNNINVLEGTAPAYGALGAGDIVFIRSKNAAGADITRTLAASVNIGSSAGTSTNWITWVLDAGTVWSGISGTLTYETSAGYTVTALAYNRIRADVAEKIVVRELAADAYAKQFVTLANCILENFFFDWSIAVASFGCQIGLSNWNKATLINPRIKCGKCYQQQIYVGAPGKLEVINPSIELTVLSDAVFRTGNINCNLLVVGGEVFGTGANATGQNLIDMDAEGSASFVGFEYPRSMRLAKTMPITEWSSLTTHGSDGGLGSAFADQWGEARSRVDGYPPYLNAFLPNSASTPWSWWLYPYAASVKEPITLTVGKIYTDTAATKTITAEVLVADTFTGVGKNSLWIEVAYIDDATGRSKLVSSFVPTGGAMDVSTAPWSATTYGAINLLKKKMSITTPTTIRQNSTVKVVLRGTIKSANTNDIMFFCPDVSIS